MTGIYNIVRPAGLSVCSCRRVCWVDTELSTRPYKILRNHTEAVRQVAYHRRYPLFASAADDCLVHVFHGMVYNDFTVYTYVYILHSVYTILQLQSYIHTVIVAVSLAVSLYS